MGKVYRQDRKSVQRIKARDIMPGDIVEVAGKIKNTELCSRSTQCGGMCAPNVTITSSKLKKKGKSGDPGGNKLVPFICIPPGGEYCNGERVERKSSRHALRQDAF